MDAERIAALSNAFLRCRDLTHAWAPLHAWRVGRGYERTLRCRVCRTVRFERLDGYGAVVTRRYSYPADYLIRGDGPAVRDVKNRMRLESLIRANPSPRAPGKRRPGPGSSA